MTSGVLLPLFRERVIPSHPRATPVFSPSDAIAYLTLKTALRAAVLPLSISASRVMPRPEGTYGL